MSVALAGSQAGQANDGRYYAMPADQVGEALLASMRLNGIERVWFVSGSEIGFIQEGAVKHRALGKPAPRVMTMTHESVALAAACARPSSPASHRRLPCTSSVA
jgi:acetolactate synthase I/II/III large subunit